eukprot:2922443-Rhodomonas_salina.4
MALPITSCTTSSRCNWPPLASSCTDGGLKAGTPRVWGFGFLGLGFQGPGLDLGSSVEGVGCRVGLDLTLTNDAGAPTSSLTMMT